jgi:hypothetical protein
MPPKRMECEYCHKKFGCRIILDHYGDCLKNVYKDKSGYLFRLFSHGVRGDVYFIYACVGLNCKFSDLDKFLKEVWCECCGHMSEFNLFENGVGPIGKIKKTEKISKYKTGDRFEYQYDMGDTTTIYLEILDVLSGEDKTKEIEILKKNEQPKIICENCDNESKYYDQENDEFVCEECAEEIEEERKLNVVNSPRTGVCGYE